MKMNHLEKSIKNAVLEKIRHGDVKKASRFIFSLQGATWVIAAFIAFAFLVFLTSFGLFALQTSGLWKLPALGVSGAQIFLGNLPWLIIVICLIFLVILERLVTRYEFAYRRPFSYTAFAIIFIVASISFAVRQTPFHENIFRETEAGRLPAMKPLYEKYAEPDPAIFHPGTVREITSDGFLLENRDKSTTRVILTQDTEVARGLRIFPGGRVTVIGKIVETYIRAEAVMNAPKNGRP